MSDTVRTPSLRDADAAPRLARELALYCLPAAICTLIYVWPILRTGNNWGVHDWDQHLFYHAVPRTTILEYGQIPLWNPYECGAWPCWPIRKREP